MKSIVFSLKMFRNDVQNVYIEIEQIGQNNPQLYEMNLKQKNQEMMLYTYPIKLDSEQLYRYRYILNNNNDLLKEENFRRFKKDKNEDEDEENLVDEWSKLWNNIQVVFDKNEFFAECEKFQIFRNLRPYPDEKSDNVVFQLKQLSDNYQFLEQQQTQTFTNYQNEQEFQIHKNQEIHINCVNTILTFGQLGKQLVKQLGPNFQFLLEQVENKFEQKDDQIKQYQQIIDQKSKQLDEQIEQLQQTQRLEEDFKNLQTQSLKKYEENINQIDQLQIEVEKQKEIAFSNQQLKVKRIDFDLNNNNVEKSQTSDELIELLQKYQNSLDQIDELKKQDNQQLQSKEKAYEFLKKKNDKFAYYIQQCENQLNDVDKKLNQYEDELRNKNEQKEKNDQTIKILRQQVKRELQNHQDFSNKKQKKSEQELQITNEDLKIKLDQLEKEKQDQVETNKNLQINLDNEKKKLEKEKKDQAKIIEELTDELAKSKSFYFTIPNFVRLFLVLIFLAVLCCCFLMNEELKRRNSIIEESKYQRNLDDEKFKNQIIQNNAQKAIIQKSEKQNVILDEYLTKCKKQEKELQNTNEDLKIKLDQLEKEKQDQVQINKNFQIQLDQMNNEKKKLEKENKQLAENIKELAMSFCIRFKKFFFGG